MPYVYCGRVRCAEVVVLQPLKVVLDLIDFETVSKAEEFSSILGLVLGPEARGTSVNQRW